jgi:hypothetical protein
MVRHCVGRQSSGVWGTRQCAGYVTAEPVYITSRQSIINKLMKKQSIRNKVNSRALHTLTRVVCDTYLKTNQHQRVRTLVAQFVSRPAGQPKNE